MFWRFRIGWRSIFYSAESIFRFDFADDRIFGEWKEVKNESLKFESIRLVGLDQLPGFVEAGDFFEGAMKR